MNKHTTRISIRIPYAAVALALLLACLPAMPLQADVVRIPEDFGFADETAQPKQAATEHRVEDYGRTRRWYDGQGQLEVEARHEDEVLQGPARWYFVNGQLAYETSFEQGVQSGRARAYHANGELRMECTFVDGKLEGEARWYDASGNLTGSLSYHNGVAQVQTAKVIPTLRGDFSP